MSFRNKVIVVTGGSAGIGAATAELFAKEGGKVVIVGRNEDNLKLVANKCRQFGTEVLVIKADLSQDKDVERVITETIKRFGKLDVLINNAGIVEFGSVLEGTVMNTFDKVMNTNLRSVVYLTSLAVPYLVKTKGNIVNISSIAGESMMGAPNYLSYGISKAGLNYLTRGVALELFDAAVRVNVVSPGPVNTEIRKRAGDNTSWEEIKEKLNFRKISEPEEIGELILYLASDKANSITGSNFRIDGGALLRS